MLPLFLSFKIPTGKVGFALRQILFFGRFMVQSYQSGCQIKNVAVTHAHDVAGFVTGDGNDGFGVSVACLYLKNREREFLIKTGGVEHQAHKVVFQNLLALLGRAVKLFCFLFIDV